MWLPALMMLHVANQQAERALVEVPIPLPVSDLAVFPPPGATGVPTNVSVLLTQVPLPLLSFIDLDTLEETVATVGFGGGIGSCGYPEASFVLVTAELLLRANASYVLAGRERPSDSPREYTNFVTGELPDDEAPPTPELGEVEAVAGAVCGGRVLVPVSLGPDQYAVVVSADGQVETAYRDDVTLERAGPLTIRIAAVDQAGNPSAPVEIDINFNDFAPPPVASSDCATSLPPMWWVLPLVLRRNRRGRR
jgi:hypothetical protein